MKTLQVTLSGSGANQITTTITPFNQMIISNNTSHVTRYGDSAITSTKGPAIAANATVSIGPFAVISTGGDASQWYIAGTAADVIDVIVI